MKVRVLYFAAVREALQRDGEEAELPTERAAASDILALLRRRHGEKWDALAQTPLRFAVNCEFAPESAELRDGDELAIFPPVTGG